MANNIDYQSKAQALLLLMDESEENPYKVFQEKYHDDPAGFVRDCFIWTEKEVGAADYQEAAMIDLAQSRRVSLRGPHGLGKSCLAAWIILWFALTRDGEDWKIPCTASAWRQLSKFLMPELHKWARRLKWEVIGRAPFKNNAELLDLSLKLDTGEAFALASDNSAMLEGAHANHILYLFDEAKTVPDDTWDAAEGAMSVGNAYMLAISTPGEPIGRFYEIQSHKAGFEDWHVIKVTKDQAIRAGRMSQVWASQRLLQWGRDSAVYQNRVEGEFASSDEDTIINLAWVERSNERWLIRKEADDFGFVTGLGVDVGRGGDPSVIGLRCGNAVKEFRRIEVKDVMAVAGFVSGLLQLHTKAKASVDVIGIGAGVVDRLREEKELSSRIIAFNAGGRTDIKDSSGELGFMNMRAAGWWAVRELLQNDEIDLPPDDELTGELVSPKWKAVSGGKIQVESKDEIKKRLGRSTNYADTVIQVFAPKEIIKYAGAFGRG
jgi:hypothetical protein